MIVNVERPLIMRIAYRQEASDPDYGSCLWAYFDFDMEKWMMNIQSDCGNYGYRWPAVKSETFMELCARINGDYLLDKLCGKPKKADGSATIESVIDAMTGGDELYELTEEEQEAVEELKEKESELDGASYDAAVWILDEWANDNGLEFDCLWEHVTTEYSGDQKKIKSVYQEQIQPLLKEMISKGQTDKELCGITVSYTDGSIKDLTSGCCVDLADKGEEISVEMLNIKPVDIVRLAYGLMACVDRMGMMDAFEKYVTGGKTDETV